MGIPIVSNLKILGHSFGKDRLICDFQNFYSKLETIEKNINIWKQRSLTIIGKNVLINSLINSTFLFNAQIDLPPENFLKSVESLNKDFLWGGTPKIAHTSLIADYNEGGIRYKDLKSFVNSINVKFVLNLTRENSSRCTILPQFWINKLFNIPLSSNNTNLQYFHNFFSQQINILDCKFKVPRRNAWSGHPFYFEILKSLEKVALDFPTTVVNILSIPIWYNKSLNTKFDIELSRAGLNYLKDCFPEGRLLNLQQNGPQITPNKIRKLRGILNRIPETW